MNRNNTGAVATVRGHAAIALILIAYIALGITYSVVDPILEASDEVFHYPVVKQIADGYGLPVQDPKDLDALWQQEGSQPPLYYLIGAAITSWIDTGSMHSLMVKNPHAQIGRPGARNNKNMVVHTADEDFPYTGVSLAVHLIRALSVLMGAGTIALTYLIVLTLAPGNRLLAAASSALAAFNPMFLFISASVNNDNLAVLLCTLCVYLVLQSFRATPSWRWALALGIVAALAALAKLSGLSLFVLVGFALASMAVRHRSLHSLFVWGLIVAACFAVIAGWWFARNLLLFGDSTGLNAMLDRAGRRKANPGPFVLWAESEGFRRSFWGVFGGFDVGADNLFYQFFDALSAIGLAGLVVRAARLIWPGVTRKTDVTIPFASAFRASSARATASRGVRAQGIHFATYLLGSSESTAVLWRNLIVCLAWVVFLLVSLTRWTQLTSASQGRLMFPAISIISLGIMAGVLTFFPRRARLPVGTALALVLLTVAAIAPFRFIQPAYARQDVHRSLDDSSLPLQSRTVYDGKMELVGYDVQPRQMQPGAVVQVTAWWRMLQPMEKNYSVYVQLRQRGEKIIAQDDAYPGNGSFATSKLKPGDVIAETHWLDIQKSAVAPAGVELSIGLYDIHTLDQLPAADMLGRPSEGKQSVTLKVIPAQSAVTPPSISIGARFQDQLELVGVDYSMNPGRSQLILSPQWKALTSLDVDYTIFVQALGESGKIVSQYDSQPRSGEYPTHLWGNGEVVVDPIELHVPPAYTGKLTLVAGAYDLSTMRRLMAGDNNYAAIGVLDPETGKLTAMQR